MRFSLRDKKIEIKPAEIERGKSYLFVVENIYSAADFESAKNALSNAISNHGVSGVVVTKPMTVVTVEMLAELEHEQWIAWTHAVVDKWGYMMPQELVEQWASKWVPYSELSEADKELDRVWAVKMVEHKW